MFLVMREQHDEQHGGSGCYGVRVPGGCVADWSLYWPPGTKKAFSYSTCWEKRPTGGCDGSSSRSLLTLVKLPGCKIYALMLCFLFSQQGRAPLAAVWGQSKKRQPSGCVNLVPPFMGVATCRTTAEGSFSGPSGVESNLGWEQLYSFIHQVIEPPFMKKETRYSTLVSSFENSFPDNMKLWGVCNERESTLMMRGLAKN